MLYSLWKRFLELQTSEKHPLSITFNFLFLLKLFFRSLEPSFTTLIEKSEKNTFGNSEREC
jgi:hypothetical protein